MPEDAIQVVISTDSTVLPRILTSHAALIDATVKQPIAPCTSKDVAARVATAAVEARGEKLGEEAVSDSTSVSPDWRSLLTNPILTPFSYLKIPPDDLIVTIFHRFPLSQTPSSNTSKGSKKQFSHPTPNSEKHLRVRCAEMAKTIEVRLVDANGKALLSDVIELLNAVSFHLACLPTSS